MPRPRLEGTIRRTRERQIALENLERNSVGVSQPLCRNTVGDEFRNALACKIIREAAVGNRLAFGSIEYRIPVAPSLETRILGVISLGKTTASLFADGAFVLTDAEFDKAVKRLGLGIELKNAISIGGLTLMHAFGASQPEHELFTSDVSYYYRIRTAIPF